MSHATAAGVRREILHAIVGTAGHVDHGKTALVKHLTGVDTDRLPEEKQRGMSIDLGFAPFILEDGRVLGIVDVPGHQDFIRNMVAGAASMDVLMLVVAADDGIMPQTEEHLRIISLLRTPRVMAVVTKIDLIEAEGRAKIRQEVDRFLRDMGYPDTPIVLMSNRTGEGVAETKQTLDRVAHEAVDEGASGLRQHEDGKLAFRMNVERVFTVKGHGTVVTGIPLSGTVRVDECLDLLPTGQRTSVRSVEAYRREAQHASAHTCIALNLRDVTADSVRRGMTLAAPGIFVATNEIMATLQNASTSATIRHREQVRFHAGTSATTASLALIGVDRLAPGETGSARVRLEEPLVLGVGDRFVIRRLTPGFTLGGGRVLSTAITRARRNAPAMHASLAAARTALVKGDLFGAALAARVEPFVSHPELLRLAQSIDALAGELIARKQSQGDIIPLGEDWLVTARRGDLLARLKGALRNHHQTNKYAWGMPPGQVCALLGIGPRSFKGLADDLGRADEDLVFRHGVWALKGHQPALSETQLRNKEALASRVLAAAVAPPAKGDLATALSLGPQEMSLLVRLLSDEGVVVVLRSHLIAAAVYQQCREKLLALFADRSLVDIATFRAATETSRRVAVDLLEAFDKESLTRRTDAGRVLVGRTSESQRRDVAA